MPRGAELRSALDSFRARNRWTTRFGRIRAPSFLLQGDLTTRRHGKLRSSSALRQRGTARHLLSLATRPVSLGLYRATAPCDYSIKTSAEGWQRIVVEKPFGHDWNRRAN